MGVSVELRNAEGAPVRGLPDPAGGTFDSAGDFDRLLPSDDPSYALLRDVNRYGETVFDALHMTDLLADLERLVGRDPKPIERRGLERLRVIAERCRDEPDLYVWCVGD